MSTTTAQTRIDSFLVKLYFTAVFVCIVCEMFKWHEWLVFFKPILIPLLALLYYRTSTRRDLLYFASLVFAWASNLLLLSQTDQFLIPSHLCILLYRVLSIVVVVRLVEKLMAAPMIVGTLPFLFIFACLVNLTLTTDSPSFPAVVLNGILLSLLSGISLSVYVLNDNKAHSWLAISTLLFVVLAFLFMIQKFYLANLAFLPMSAFVFAFGHFAFYKFMIESEHRRMLHHN